MKTFIFAAAFGIAFCTSAVKVFAENETATPEEVVAKVQAAAKLLSEQGSAGLKTLRDPNSEYAWKDTYVFVVNCDADEVMANSAFPERQGGDIKQHTDYNGYQYGNALCQMAEQPGGGWVEYVWLKPGGETPMRKVSFVTSVNGRPYQLGAGIYNETVSLDALTAMMQ